MERVEQNEVRVRLEEALQIEEFNGWGFESGVLWMQTTLGCWTANIGYAAKKLTDLL